ARRVRRRESWRGPSKGVPDRRRSRLDLVEKSRQRKELAIAAASSAKIRHDPRHVGEITIFAVSMVKPGEDAQDLQLSLHAHPLEISPERGKVIAHAQTRVARTFPVTHGPVELMLLVPCDVGVAQQGNEIVGNRPINRVLEIKNARVRGRYHEVARVVIAVDEDAGLRQVVVENAPKGSRKYFALRVAKSDTEMLGNIPFRKQIELTLQQRFIAAWQNPFAAGELPGK